MFFKSVKATVSIILIALILISTCSIENISYSAAVPVGYSPSNDEKEVEIGSRFADLIFGKRTRGKSNDAVKDTYLCPGGDAFGVKILADRVSVMRVITPLVHGTLEVNDVIIAIDGNDVYSIDDVKVALSTFSGKALSFTISRNGKNITEHITPISNGTEYHLGVILTDMTSGIGTITYYNPANGEFGGLGHGITSKVEKNASILTRGTATSVILGGIKKGADGQPGELRGVLTDRTIGSVFANTECGVFGTLNTPSDSSNAIQCASREEIKCGDATIISTVKNGNKSEYSVRISDIDLSSSGSKSFRITVTDETLVALTGGIVRGMSGSPIIQDGKLVGAVTHVMINDPTEGYGIFIENMLSSAENVNNSSQKAA